MMNKKELAALASLGQQLREARAFRLTEKVSTDVDPPSGCGALAKGWMFNSWNDSVSRACTNAVNHNATGDDRATTQRPMHLYSTELRALKALRHEVENICMKRLAEIDKRIEAAQ